MISKKSINTNTKTKKRVKKNNFTCRDIEGDMEFPMFVHEKDRLRYMKENYSNMDIVRAFSLYYDENVGSSLKDKYAISHVTTIEVGKIVTASVRSLSTDGITFDIAGVKEEIVSKEHFGESVIANMELYLAKHNNKMSVEVREFKNGRWIVSVMNAYYRIWKNAIEKAIRNEDGIQVHVDSLFKGGYLCSTPIWTIQELTGQNYTSCCFIPGSQIILGVETEFEKWVGHDLVVVPQKFGTFRKASGCPIEDSVVCSRKRGLQKIGIQNLYNMYMIHNLKSNLTDKSETTYKARVSGIINSNNKTGVFVELLDNYVSGMINVSPDELLDYKPNDEVVVRLKCFDTVEDKEPFIVQNDKIIKCFTKPVFELV